MTALHMAALKGEYELMRYLVHEKRVSPNIQDAQGCTICHYSRYIDFRGDDYLSLCVDDLHSDPAIKDYQGRNTLHYLLTRGMIIEPHITNTRIFNNSTALGCVVDDYNLFAAIGLMSRRDVEVDTKMKMAILLYLNLLIDILRRGFMLMATIIIRIYF